MAPPAKNRADSLAISVGDYADRLLAEGYHPGEVTFALCVALTIVAKAKGSGDKAQVKALVCETIDQVWRFDDEAQAAKFWKRNGN